MKLANDGGELSGAAIFRHDFPESFSADRIKRFGQINVGGVQVGVLFLTFLLELPGSKHHVDRPTFFPEAALTFRQKAFLQMFDETVEENSCQCFACD